MMIRIYTFALMQVILLLFVSTDAFGQLRDFQTWYEVEFNKGLKNGMDLSAEVEQRFKNNSLKYDRTQFTLGAEYDVTDYFNAAGGVRALLTTGEEQNIHARYRIHADATGSHTLRDVDFSLRVRVHYGIEDLDHLGFVAGNNLVYRNRFETEYHIFGTRFGVVASLESFHLLSGNPSRRFYKMRYTAGAEYALNFRSAFNIKYIFEDKFNVTNPLHLYILSMGYSRDF